MDINLFSQQVSELRSRAGELLRCKGEPWLAQQSPRLLAEVFQEFEAALEELQISQEELHLQNEQLQLTQEELFTTHQIVVAEQQRYQELFEFAPDGYLVTNSQGVIQEANHTVARLLGTTQLYLVSLSLDMVVAEAERPGFRQRLRQLQDGTGAPPERQTWETRLQLRNCALLDAALTVSAVREAGQLVALRWLVRDISDRKRDEVAKAQSLARERAALLEARQANRAKDEFLSMLSHELRSPLNAILGWVQLLRGGKLDPSLSTRALETIERNTKAQTKLVKDLLDGSQVVTGRQHLNVCACELVPIIKAALETVRHAAAAKAIQLEVRLDTEVGCVCGDPDRLQQILWNLLSNAIRFTPSQGSVTVHLRRLGDQAQIQVRDTGQGIRSEFLPYVFDRFCQADNTITRSHGGLGLGLAIVHHLVELHGGTVEADSSGEGQGATFTINLPLLRTHSPASFGAQPGLTIAESDPGAAHLPDLTGIRVLVVDDEADAREFLTTALELLGAEVIAVGSVAEALIALEQLQPNVLASDIGMPGEDGYDLIRRVRALDAERGGQIPAAALTAYAQAEDRQRVLAAGFQQHLPKPVELDQLAVVVADLARRDRSR